MKNKVSDWPSAKTSKIITLIDHMLAHTYIYFCMCPCWGGIFMVWVQALWDMRLLYGLLMYQTNINGSTPGLPYYVFFYSQVENLPWPRKHSKAAQRKGGARNIFMRRLRSPLVFLMMLQFVCFTDRGLPTRRGSRNVPFTHMAFEWMWMLPGLPNNIYNIIFFISQYKTGWTSTITTGWFF